MSIRIKEEPSMADDDDHGRDRSIPIPMQVDGDDDDDEEEDEIVRVMDVYLSPQVAQQLYLLQYPLQQLSDSTPESTTSSHRHSNNKTANSQIVGARVKPKHNMIEIDHGIPTSYIETEGTVHLPQRTFASHTVPVTTHLALGKIVEAKNGGGNHFDNNKNHHELHISPLTHITQMRPTFTHIDMNDLDNIRSMEEKEEKLAAQQAKLDRKPLMFQKKESERAALARKNSYAYKKASEDGEHWIELTTIVDLQQPPNEDEDDDDLFCGGGFNDLGSFNQGGGMRQQLQQRLECPPEAKSQVVVDENNDATIQMQQGEEGDDDTNNNNNNSHAHDSSASLVSYVRSLDYLPAPIPNNSGDDGNNNDDDPWLYKHPDIVDWIQHGLDETAFDLPTLGGHLTALLRGGWPIPYSILRQTLPPLVKDKDILEALSSCAVMIRGNFCLQSRLLMPKLPKSVAKARTFIMLLLQSTGIVHRKRLDHVFGIQSGPQHSRQEVEEDDDGNNNNNNNKSFATEDMTKEILNYLLENLGKKTPNGWVLRLQDDVMFLAKHPQNTHLHMQYWGRQMIRFQDYLKCYASAGG